MHNISQTHLARRPSRVSPLTAGPSCAGSFHANSPPLGHARFGLAVSRLDDAVLLRRLARLVARDRVTTAALLAHIAEVDARRLYAPAGYPSMHAYCVGVMRLSEDAASKRIQAARAARKAPALLGALAEGRLHLSGVCLLAPHVTEKNAEELIAAATHRSKSEIEGMLWRRFLAPADAESPGEGERPAPGRGSDSPALVAVDCDNLVVDEHAPGHVAALVTPSPERISLRVTITASTERKLRYARALLSHAVPSGDPGEVLDRALDALIEKVEKRRFGSPTGSARHARVARATTGSWTTEEGSASRPVAPQRLEPAEKIRARSRYIPAHVRRAVWERDGGRCTFVGGEGHRCESHRFLEFDHVEPVARGGRATVDGLRLRCRAHNQYEAERIYGVGFMENKRREVRRPRQVTQESDARVEPCAQDPAEERARMRLTEHRKDILTCLQGLGCRAGDARRAAARAAALHGATFEERLRLALRSLPQRGVSVRALMG